MRQCRDGGGIRITGVEEAGHDRARTQHFGGGCTPSVILMCDEREKFLERRHVQEMPGGSDDDD